LVFGTVRVADVNEMQTICECNAFLLSCRWLYSGTEQLNVITRSANYGNKQPTILHTSAAPVGLEFSSVKVALFIERGYCILHIKPRYKKLS